MKVGQIGIKIALGLMLLIFLVPTPGFATCGLFDFHIQFGSTPKKKPEKKKAKKKATKKKATKKKAKKMSLRWPNRSASGLA